MREHTFLKVFDFQYTEHQWEQIQGAIDTQPGTHYKQKIRESLERLARQFLIEPQIDAHVPRKVNLALASAVAKCCDDLKNLLSETNVRREGSFYIAFKSSDEYAATIGKIGELEDATKLVEAINRPLSQKRKQADPLRDKYLGALCHVWVREIHGKPTTSYSKRAGQASGHFVDFLVSAAQPVLKQFTPEGARRFIRRWKTGMAV